MVGRDRWQLSTYSGHQHQSCFLYQGAVTLDGVIREA